MIDWAAKRPTWAADIATLGGGRFARIDRCERERSASD